ncbi:hypothetical protein [Pseudogracilibacillus auburnensis]|uniref:hypothetical protein n=1 Tax=Pseudogracilibacillus auburnensis TaxID=1494959 RepID=UPI001A96CB39|nr:hypothetical protein [Pseudogracilibacillus auburnensis]MBO1001838.1 hypothetical protein [Pseudogracilibacillus auburnensis]
MIQLLNNEIEEKNQMVEDKDSVIKNKDSFIDQLRMDFEKSIKSEKELKLEKAREEAEQIIAKANEELKTVVDKTIEYKNDMEELSEEHNKLQKEVNRYKAQARKFKAEVLGLKNIKDRFPHTINFEDVEKQVYELKKELSEESLLGTVIRLHLHSDHSKD